MRSIGAMLTAGSSTSAFGFVIGVSITPGQTLLTLTRSLEYCWLGEGGVSGVVGFAGMVMGRERGRESTNVNGVAFGHVDHGCFAAAVGGWW